VFIFILHTNYRRLLH